MSSRLESRLERLEKTVRQPVRASVDIRDHIAPCYLDLYEDIRAGRHTFYNLAGGRGSGKSSFISLDVIEEIMQDQTGLKNALVIRKYANTLRGSVFNQLLWAINTLGVADQWRSTVIPLQLIYRTGQVIRFSGLDDPVKLKSLKPERGYFSVLWIEEFSEITGEPELRNLQQSVLRGGDGFKIFRSFNPPISRRNWVNEFAERQEDNSLTFRTDYRQMPAEWLGSVFLTEAERLKEINPTAYEHEYLGIATGTGSEVFPNLEVRTITDEELENQSYFYQGLDFGFAQDPFAFVRLAYDQKHDTIYFVDEIVKKGCSNTTIADMIMERGYDRDALGRIRITADSAEPKSIADLQDCGLKVSKCKKFAGCVQYRTRWLQHRRIIIDSARTPISAKEFTNYSYVVDRSGEITSELPDKDNHTIDATAYALDKLIYRKGISA